MPLCPQTLTDSSPTEVRQSLTALRATLLAAVLSLLAACATPPPVIDDAEIERRLAEAEAHLAEDRPLAAVRIYRDLADAAEPADAQRWRLSIVELLFDSGYPELALDFHARLDAEPVPPGLEQRKRVTDAQAAIARQQGARALTLLPDPDPSMSLELRARIIGVRAEAYVSMDRPERALAAYVEREPLLERDTAIDHNRERIWSLLSALDIETIETIASRGDTRTERGWAELALAADRALTGRQRIGEALEQWQRRYHDHPAIPRFIESIRDRVIAELTYPERVDVLLPLSGRLADAGSAVRDGILATYYNLPAYIQRPELVIHDIGDDGDSIQRAYTRAMDARSGFIIGPLDRDDVTRLAQRRELPVPVFTLNYLGANAPSPPAGMYQFGLSPEDEARQAAEAAIRDDRFNAVVLIPAGDWGRRLLSAFRERYEELGGVVVESAAYDGNASDFGHSIQAVLNIDDSRARHRILQSTVGGSPRFEPRRRDDAEVVFLAALPRQARIAIPQLKFHRIDDIPVYATSNVFTGRPDPDSDWDMNDLFFTEIPWVMDMIEGNPDPLQRTLAEQWPDAFGQRPRLFALGADALEILPRIRALEDGGGQALRTGRLSIDQRGRVQRRLEWARFVRGVPERVPQPTLDDGEEAELGADIRERTGQND